MTPPRAPPDETDPQPELRTNPIGRRKSDHRGHTSWWVLVIGVLFQGGNFLIVREMMARDDVQRTAERTMLQRQHSDMMELLRAENRTNEALAEQVKRAVDVLQTAAGETAQIRVRSFRPAPEKASR